MVFIFSSLPPRILLIGTSGAGEAMRLNQGSISVPVMGLNAFGYLVVNEFVGYLVY
jgi:hypothetical protein